MDRITRNTEEEIVQLAIKAFRKHVPLDTQIETLAKEPYYPPVHMRPDLLLRMVIQSKELYYYANIMNIMRRTDRLVMLLTEKDRLPHPLLVIAKYINPQIAEQLMHDGLEFIDTAGNAFINQPPLYIFVHGNRPLEIPWQTPGKRAFMPTGLKMIYAFLCNPELVNKTFREITATADVALGTVNWIMKELQQLGFLLDMGKRGYKLIQKDILLQRWVTAYAEQLRPRQMLGVYKGEHGNWWQQKKLDPLIAQWGGEIAAAKLTQYLNPQIVTIYTVVQHLNQLLLDFRLRKDATGDVEILDKFWKPVKTWQYEDLVHPILIYADLLATGNERNIETAKLIYEQHIIRLIRED
jgi:hypothetical protein